MLMCRPRQRLGALAALVALALPVTVQATTAGSVRVPAAQSSAEAQLIARLNAVRAQGVTCPGSGRRPVAGALTYTPALAAAARIQAGYMSSSGRVTHTGSNGSTPRIRAASTGVNAVSVTEIVFMGGSQDPESAVRWWLQSAVHCYWMNEGRYTHVGAAAVQGSRGTAYVMVLSSQPR